MVSRGRMKKAWITVSLLSDYRSGAGEQAAAGVWPILTQALWYVKKGESPYYLDPEVILMTWRGDDAYHEMLEKGQQAFTCKWGNLCPENYLNAMLCIMVACHWKREEDLSGSEKTGRIRATVLRLVELPGLFPSFGGIGHLLLPPCLHWIKENPPLVSGINQEGIVMGG